MFFLVFFCMKFGNIGDAIAFPEDQPYMPPLEEIKRLRVINLPGNLATNECLGVGFLRKKIYNDLVNRRFPNFVLVLVLTGNGIYIDHSGREYALQPGSTFMRLPDLEHSNYVIEDSNYLECYLEIGPRMFQALNELNIIQISPPVHKIDLSENMDLPRRIWHLGWQLNYAPDEKIPEAVAEMISLFGEIKKLSYATETDEKYSKLVELACRELSRNFAKPLSVQKFCRNNSIGYENFRKLFKMHTGMAPWEYRINCRMKTAVELLRNGSLSLKEIAAQLGYHSSYEFSAQFKKKFNIPPGAYRKMH